MEQTSQQVMAKFMNLMTTHVSGQADFMLFLFLCLMGTGIAASNSNRCHYTGHL